MPPKTAPNYGTPKSGAASPSGASKSNYGGAHPGGVSAGNTRNSTSLRGATAGSMGPTSSRLSAGGMGSSPSVGGATAPPLSPRTSQGPQGGYLKGGGGAAKAKPQPAPENEPLKPAPKGAGASGGPGKGLAKAGGAGGAGGGANAAKTSGAKISPSSSPRSGMADVGSGGSKKSTPSKGSRSQAANRGPPGSPGRGHEDEYSSSGDEEVVAQADPNFEDFARRAAQGPLKIEEKHSKGWKRLYMAIYSWIFHVFPSVYILVWQARVGPLDSFYMFMLLTAVFVATSLFCVFDAVQYLSARTRTMCCGPVLAAVWLCLICWSVFQGMEQQASIELSLAASIGLYARFDFFPFTVPVVLIANCQHRRLKRKERNLAKRRRREQEMVLRRVPDFVWKMKRREQEEYLAEHRGGSTRDL